MDPNQISRECYCLRGRHAGLTKVGPVAGFTSSVTFSAIHLMLRNAAFLGPLKLMRGAWSPMGCLIRRAEVLACWQPILAEAVSIINQNPGKHRSDGSRYGLKRIVVEEDHGEVYRQCNTEKGLATELPIHTAHAVRENNANS